MSGSECSIGIVGGTGMLGSAIAEALLDRQVVPPDRLRIANRSGAAGALADRPGVTVTTCADELATACDVVLLAVPPAAASRLAIGAPDRLVISVMAGVPLDALARATGSGRIIRAMSSPAARQGLAYSPWCAGPGVTAEDRRRAAAIFAACGLADEVETESHLDCFTALTGPVPGFVAFYARVMVDYATERGIPPAIADRAVRQLFLGAGTLMSAGAMTPADHVEQLIAYRGTTAAGLEAMARSPIASDIAAGLDAAVARTRSIA